MFVSSPQRSPEGGVMCEVYTRRWSPELADVVVIEPGFAVHHVAAGPPRPVAKETLQEHVGEFTESVIERMTDPRFYKLGYGEAPAEAIHANYWLSGLSGHAIKHRLGLPLVSTFHTLDRVKAEASPEEVETAEPGRRARAESEVIGCSDALFWPRALLRSTSSWSSTAPSRTGSRLSRWR